MQVSKKQLIIVGGVLIVAIIALFLIWGNLRSSSAPPQVSLSVWGILDNNAALQDALATYGGLKKNVKVTYRKIDPADYDRTVLDALASGHGPDVFMIHNRSLPEWTTKLAPVPVAQLGLAQFRALFPTVVEQDFVSDGQIYALPTYVDTLALIYNKDAFDQAGIVEPPKTWNDFQDMIPSLRTLTPSGQIEKAAAAIGSTDKTVNAGTDILELLMIQNGVPMTDDNVTKARFGLDERGVGLRAMNFYLGFANPVYSAYTWSDSQPPAIESFSGGKVAMIFGYQKDVAFLKSHSPFLNIGIAPVPQVRGAQYPVSYADYWGFAVSRQTANYAWAWDFVSGLATQATIVKAYQSESGRPPAVRSLIGELKNDPELGVFARQALQARSWYQADEGKIKTIMNSAISNVLNGQLDSAKALKQAENQVTDLMQGVGSQ